jgi:glycosyltransferase involved in cell wall biosynthesis
MLLAWSLKAFTHKPDLLVVGTDPILSAAVAIPWKIIRPSTRIAHWCFDLYPEAALADGLLPAGRLLNLLGSVMRSAYRRVDLLVDIGPCMRHLLSRYASPAQAVTLPPWALIESRGPSPIDPAQRAAAFGDAQIGLMYSGNFGRAHSFTEILAIARLLRDAGVHLSFAIRGNCVSQVEDAVTADDRNVSFAGFVPQDQLEARLSAADIHVVSLRPEWTGTVVPSKFFGALAVGRPVLFIGSEDSSVAQIIHQYGVGWVCSPGNETRVADELRQVASNPWRLQALRESCYQVYQAHFSREIIVNRFDSELRALVGESSETAIPATVGAR